MKVFDVRLSFRFTFLCPLPKYLPPIFFSFSLKLERNMRALYFVTAQCLRNHKTCYVVFTYARVMGCGATEATGLSFVCFVVTNPCVLSAKRVDFGLFFCFIHFPIPPRLPVMIWTPRRNKYVRSRRKRLNLRPR